jgi:DNA-binding transcriptional LysR family regulator
MADMIQNMRIFVRVVEAGTFTAVAKEMDVAAGYVSRAVSLLEEELQTVLIQRTTRHLFVTTAGAKYYERAKAILADIDNANAEARNATSRPEGRLRVHCAPGLALSHVTKILVAYQAANREVSIELEVSQTMPNLVEDRFDLSLISATELPDSAYVAQSLGTAYPLLVASPEYLDEHGTPAKPDDLAGHSLLRLATPVSAPDAWYLENSSTELLVSVTTSPFQVNSPEALRAALHAGAGIGMLATYSAVDDLRVGALVRVLPQYRLRSFQVYAVYASRRYLDAKIRTLMEYLRATLSPALIEARREVEALGSTATAHTINIASGMPSRKVK